MEKNPDQFNTEETILEYPSFDDLYKDLHVGERIMRDMNESLRKILTNIIQKFNDDIFQKDMLDYYRLDADDTITVTKEYALGQLNIVSAVNKIQRKTRSFCRSKKNRNSLKKRIVDKRHLNLVHQRKILMRR